jgi:hypothetical protein
LGTPYKNAVAVRYDGFGVDLIGDADAGVELVFDGAVCRGAYFGWRRQKRQTPRRSSPVLSARGSLAKGSMRGLLVVVAFHVGAFEFVAEAEVEGEAGGDFVVVLAYMA